MAAEKKIIVPTPAAPCAECVESAVHQSDEFGLVWCEHTRYGGIYIVEAGIWSITGPYGDESAFKRAIYAQFARQLMRKSH